jgi:hypothetical protein
LGLGPRSVAVTQGRDELRIVLDFLRSGDVPIVIRIDHLARSIGDLQDIVRTIKALGASLKATEQPIDISLFSLREFQFVRQAEIKPALPPSPNREKLARHFRARDRRGDRCLLRR